MTAKILKFPENPAAVPKVKAENAPGWAWDFVRSKKVYRLWKLSHLEGKRPSGHPKRISHGPRGRVLIERSQVWVESRGYLVVVVAYGGGRVYFRDFRRRVNNYSDLSEQTFRGCYKIWEEAIENGIALAKKLRHIVENGEAKNFFSSHESACSFFGMDPKTGTRVD